MDKTENGSLRIKKKKKNRMSAFYTEHKSRQSQNEAHKRLKGNLGTK